MMAGMSALEKAKKDPSSLHGFLKKLKDRDKRGDMLQKWLDSVADDDEDTAAGEEPPQKEPALRTEARLPRP